MLKGQAAALFQEEDAPFHHSVLAGTQIYERYALILRALAD